MASDGTWTIRASTPAARASSRAMWSHVSHSSLVMCTASPIADAFPSRPTKPLAKSVVWVRVHRDVPSPWMTTSSPRSSLRTIACRPPRIVIVLSYVCDGRTTVIGSPSFCQRSNRYRSHAALSRLYCQNGFDSGVPSRIGRTPVGFWYADAELMNTYCPACPSTCDSVCVTWSGVKLRKSHTLSKCRSPIAAVIAPGSRTSAEMSSTPSGTGRTVDCPRLSTVTSQPRCAASATLPALITPVPPRKSTRPVMQPIKPCPAHGCETRTAGRPD